jgi:hypothetical protein
MGRVKMNKQELIDKYIDNQKGIWCHSDVDAIGINTGGGSVYNLWQKDFEKRASELGWINGVKQENKVPTPYGVLKFGGQPGGMGAPDADDWWDYENDKPIKPPPVDLICEAFDYQRNEWLKVKILKAETKSKELACVTLESAGHWGCLFWGCKFRPLDHATRKADIERKRVVGSVVGVNFDGYVMTEATANALYDKGYLRMPEDK